MKSDFNADTGSPPDLAPVASRLEQPDAAMSSPTPAPLSVSLGSELRRISRNTLHAVVVITLLITIVSSVAISSVSLVEGGGFQTKVLAQALSAPLAFEDVTSADDMLPSFERLPAIDSVTVHTLGEELFWSYRRGLSMHDAIAMADVMALLPAALRQIEFVEPVQFNNHIIGTVRLNLSLSSLYWQALWLLLGAMFSMYAAGWVSRWWVKRLNADVITPLNELENVTRKVARSADYSQRAAPGRIQEVNSLALSFNTMLEQLRQRDASLLAQREQLEQLVERRTADLSKAKDAAEAASRTKSSFLATMSHEIRTPLNGVLGLNELLLGSTLDSQQRGWASDIQASGQQLMRVINDVLDFSKIEAGHMLLESVDFELRDLVEDCLVVFTPAAEEKNLELVADLDPGGKPLLLRGDPFRLRQVITNMLSNAIKFTHAGGVVVRVQGQQEPDGLVALQVCVEDTGIGISHDAIEKLFENFTQVDSSTTRDYGGTGLGLAICKRLLKLMGGDIRVQSTVGKGSKFCAELRLPQSRRPLPQSLETESIRGRHVLLAVSANFTQEVLLRQFTAWGMQVNTTSDPCEVPKLVQSAQQAGHAFDFIVLQSPARTTGAQLLAQEHPAWRGLSGQNVVVLTAPGAAQMVSNNAQRLVGLSRPIRRADLRLAVQAALGLGHAAGIQADNGAMAASLSIHGRILLVEDNPINQRLTAAMLQRFGLTVELAASGLEALEKFEHCEPDLILMDCQMPQMDGYQATAALRQRTAERQHRLPIVALTANAMQDDEQKCLDAGMDDFLSKPFTQDQLGKTLARWLPHKQPMHMNHSSEKPAPPVVPDVTINREQLDTIRQLDPQGETGLVQELLTNFIGMTHQAYEEIQAALQAGDCKTLCAIAHKHKSSSATLGADQLAALYRQFEKWSRDSALDELQASLPALRQLQQQSIAAIQNLLKEQGR